MYRVGLTGNAAAGKSTVTKLLSSWGATIIDADHIVRQLQEPGQPVFQAIVDRFGPEVVTEDGLLDRDALRQLILSDHAKRETLNALVHPAVAKARESAEEQAKRDGAALVIHSIPLLFEVMRPDDFDDVVLVDAPEAIRRERLTSLRGLTDPEAEALIGAQMPASEKRGRATWIIDNGGSTQDLGTAVRQIWEDIQKRASDAA